MAPLAQKHDIKWRQMIWSEHVHVLRFVTCTENEVNSCVMYFYDINFDFFENY